MANLRQCFQPCSHYTKLGNCTVMLNSWFPSQEHTMFNWHDRVATTELTDQGYFVPFQDSLETFLNSCISVTVLKPYCKTIKLRGVNYQLFRSL